MLINPATINGLLFNGNADFIAVTAGTVAPAPAGQLTNVWVAAIAAGGSITFDREQLAAVKRTV